MSRRALPDAPTPLRILHLMRAPVGGLFRHVLDLAGEQAQRGHAVGLVADRNTTDSLTEEKLVKIAPQLQLGLSLIPMSRHPGLGDMTALLAVAKIARPLDLDVLHGHGAKGGAYARLARPLLGRAGRRTKVFYTPHGGSLHYAPGSTSGILIGRLERIMGRLTDGLIFESDFACRAYGRLVGNGGPPRRVIPNGLQPRDFAIPSPAPDAADFLFIGELRALKGVDILLEGLAKLVAKRPVRAVIVGSGPDAGLFKAEAKRLGLSAHVTFPGAMPAKFAFPLGRALVVPSRAESFPYVVLEAGAAAKPLIATSVGGIPEIVAGSDTTLIPAGSVPDLVRAMEAFLDEPERARLQADRLRDAVRNRFTVGAMTDAVLDFYTSA